MLRVDERLRQFKKKYYLYQALRGVLLSFLLTLSFYLIFAVLEYFGHFHSSVRALFFFGLLFTLSGTLLYYVLRPLGAYAGFYSLMSDEEAARYIGNEIPEISDKLLNALQLKRQFNGEDRLLLAAIEQKEAQIAGISLWKALPIEETKQAARYSLIPLLLLIILFLAVPSLLVESSQRIIQYKKHFPKPAPFQFLLSNTKLSVFRGEDLPLVVETKGKLIPKEMYVVLDQSTGIPMQAIGEGRFAATLPNIQKSHRLFFQSGEYTSHEYQIELKEKPFLLGIKLSVEYPAYTGKTQETFQNATNLLVPAGSKITWHILSKYVQKTSIFFSSDSTEVEAQANGKDNDRVLSKKFTKSTIYQIILYNADTSLQSSPYQIDVIPDLAPVLEVQNFEDTLSYRLVGIAGSARDDYGISRAVFAYRILRKGSKTAAFKQQAIRMNGSNNYVRLLHKFDLSPLNLQPGDVVEYFVQIWDNNQVNGAQSARSPLYRFEIPTAQELEKEIKEESRRSEEKMRSALEKEKELNEELKRAEERMRLKKQLDFSDKKQLENIIQKRQDVEQEIEQLQDEFQKLQDKINRFEQPSPELMEKMQELQKLMDTLLDEETKKLYEELQQLLDKMMQDPEVLKKLQEIQQNEEELEKSLERTLELFKQLQFEQQLEQSIEKLHELYQKQEQLQQETQQTKAKDQEKLSELKQQQEELQKELQKVEEELKELQELNEKLSTPQAMPDLQEEQQKAKESMQQSIQQLEQKNPKKAGEPQQKAKEQIQQMQQKLQQMQQSMQQQQIQENIQTLRHILDNLLQLSFEQEQLIEETRQVNVQDPRYVELIQRQYKIEQSSQIVKDSLWALAKRVFQLQSFITEEVGEMETALKQSLQSMKERKIRQSNIYQQQAMTRINNLALMLSDLLEQMQNPAGSGKGKPQKNQKNTPSMSELQKQLNQQIQQLKEGKQQGRQLSEQLAKLAAQQELLRRKIEELQKSGELSPEQKQMLEEIKQEMEKTEKDLINKNLTQETLKRQKEIETRLLEAEKSLRERGEEDKRKGETATPKERKELPPPLREYLKKQQEQLELIESVPPSMTPYFKQRTDEYLKQIKP